MPISPPEIIILDSEPNSNNDVWSIILSISESTIITPSAKIIPGKAYPKREMLIAAFVKMLFDELLEMTRYRATTNANNDDMVDKMKELKNKVIKFENWISFNRSITKLNNNHDGRTNPINTGIKHIIKKV